MTLKELKNKWNKEQGSYRNQEVGTGVHSFIRDCLKSDEIFSLKEGALSTSPLNRKKEFIHEKKAKEGRRADFVLFISRDIVIPLEAERYGNIEAGVKQLIKYQRDFDKQYGILTDGFCWRFYNNNAYREFNLDQILQETDIFLEFWNEYIKPESYYLAFFEPPGQISLLKDADKLHVEDYRQIFFDDITKLIDSFNNKLQIEGYFKGLDRVEKKKRAVEITYAYIIQFILYKTLVDNDFTSFADEFDSRLNETYECLKVKQYGKILGIIKGISDKISQNIYRPFKKEEDFIKNTLLDLFSKPKNELHEVSPWLDIFVFIKKYNFANIQNEIFGYIYENYLKELYEEKKKGQYFTDPAVVNFMLQQIGFNSEAIKERHQKDKDSISLIDPSCGSGTFLYCAVDSIVKAFGKSSPEKSTQVTDIVNKNIFGLDIAEFPLYLAEMSILMRMLPLIINEKYNNPIDKKIKVFLTKDSISEFMDTGLRNTINDIDTKGGQLPLGFQDLDLGYKSYVREESDLEEMKKSLEHQPKISRFRFDYVVGNPPYVSYNECSKQGVLVFDLIKKNKVKLNNIYGVNLHSTPSNPKKYRPNPNLFAFFIALGIALLKDNGKLCYIIPQTVLINADFDVIRYHLAKFTTIEKLIAFSGKMFIGRGLRQNKPVSTSSLIFIVNRKLPSATHQVEIIRHKGKNQSVEDTLRDISANRNISKNKISQSNFLQNINNWNIFKQSKGFVNFYEEYKNNTIDISIYSEHVLAEKYFESKFYFDGGYSIDEKKLMEKPVSGLENYVCPRLDDSLWTIRKICGYWPNIRKRSEKMFIDLRQGNQGYNFLDSKYKIIWSYNNTGNFFFTDLPVIWARNKILGIGSENRNELLYLFALLNSKITKCLLNNIVKIGQEDRRTILVSLQIIKDQIRVPKINEKNRHIKDEIVRSTDNMLKLEANTLDDVVDFSKVMMQKFDRIIFRDKSIIIENDGNSIKLPVKDKFGLTQRTLEDKFGKKNIDLGDGKQNVAELRAIPIIDFEGRRLLKSYIDDLVFSLYFNIGLEEIGFKNAVSINKKCAKNQNYKIINQLEGD